MKKQIFTKGRIKIGILFFAILLMVAGFSYLQNINSTQAQGGSCVGGVTDPNCWSTNTWGVELAWGPIGVTTGVSTNITHSNGRVNTAILHSLNTTAYPAANYCYNLTEGNVPVGTWYLPSYAELSAGWNSFGINGFPSVEYWSSTEYSGIPDSAAHHMFGYSMNLMHASYKDARLHVRCLRVPSVFYTVTFDSQSATVPASPTTKIIGSPEITVVTLPTAPTKTGFTFSGWYTAKNGGGTEFTAATPVTANITVYAKWTGNPVPTSKGITSFSFTNPSITGVIDEKHKVIYMPTPDNTDLSIMLTPIINVSSGATVSPLSGQSQSFEKGTKKYTVTAKDGSKQDYTVVISGRSSDTSIKSFYLTNPITGKIKGVVDEKNNTIQFNYNLELNNDSFDFVPEIEISKKAMTSPASGVSQNFFNPIKYTVTAGDGVSKKEYTVIFNNPKKSVKDIQSIEYSLHRVPVGWPKIVPDDIFVGSAMIDQNLKVITYHIPFVPFGATNEYVVNPKSGRIISDSDSQVFVTGTDYNPADYETPVNKYPFNYTVRAQNGSIKYYDVNLIIGAPVPSLGQYCGSSACGSQSAQVIQAGITGVKSIETIQVGPYREFTPGKARVVSCPAGTNYDVCVENQNDDLYNYVLLGVKTQNSSTINLTISSSTINFGKSVVLTWDPTNMTSCTASGGSTGWEGGKDPSDGIHTWTSNGLAVGKYTYNISCITPSIAGVPGKTISSKAVVVVSNPPTFAGGNGTLSNPYQISNWTQLNNIKNYLTKSFVLTENLSSTTDGYFGSGDNWAPIGRPAQQMFTGNFNGNGHTISDLITTQTGGLDTLGLFGYSRGNISNLGLINVKVVGRAYLGGLVGNMLGGTITSSYTTGSVTGDNGVSSGRSGAIGGLVGQQGGGTITNSYSTANVSGAYSGSIGGLVGYLNAGTASNSYSTGRVLSTTSVSNRNAIGGLVGYVFQGYVTNSFWDVNTSGQLNMCHSEYSYPEVRNGCDKANGKTTAEMKTLSTFATWDTSKWNFVEGFYPALKTP